MSIEIIGQDGIEVPEDHRQDILNMLEQVENVFGPIQDLLSKTGTLIMYSDGAPLKTPWGGIITAQYLGRILGAHVWNEKQKGQDLLLLNWGAMRNSAEKIKVLAHELAHWIDVHSFWTMFPKTAFTPNVGWHLSRFDWIHNMQWLYEEFYEPILGLMNKTHRTRMGWNEFREPSHIGTWSVGNYNKFVEGVRHQPDEIFAYLVDQVVMSTVYPNWGRIQNKGPLIILDHKRFESVKDLVIGEINRRLSIIRTG